MTLVGHLGKGRYRVQVDIGLGDAVVPEPDWIEYPTLLDFPAPRLRAYRPETAIAEKVHAMVELGERNTRIRDFLDVYTLARESAFDGEALRAAITATFARRKTAVPVALPIALSDGFAADRSRRSSWRAFIRRSRAGSTLPEFPVVVQALREFLLPVLIAAGRGDPFDGRWEQGGPWR